MSLQEKRLTEINNILSKTGFMTTVDIAKNLQVSPMTIRRDLKRLEEQGKITRIYGGAQSNNQTESTTNEKLKKNIVEKKEIAKLLANEITNNSTIFLGAGTTLLMAVPLLIPKNLTFVTNSLPAFNEINKSDCRLLLTGGELHRNTEEFLGEKAENIFNGLNLDYALCSTNGISENRVTTSTIPEGNIQNIAIAHSEKSFVVADHTKLDHSDIITFQKLDKFDCLVTDPEIENEKVKKYSKYIKMIY
ncbi:DeoR/GlpR family DNA-binding transcription regulator [Lactobacillus sp. ESL0731]|uniref:DeoR/GlpR family DNA-binding transcription regulator n=1 Tax=unclassified Lactobacillus TaxID=2620435 RepID=UPI0023F74944|nr:MULTISPECIES: DeoR/GlpR family DNA-binding transcription regulator [unclassified Lactobacillus]WEV38920.1 DeoR/GlpR family DNA-binding transcription regulator [Lactobacillus sp. ESL0680]WEV51355.1 DeoR/GlpR family DNA-binding transcription regulator [Lactobacillus sp. ESL0700]WEV62485.1 DeoR/GlpR family DNA-binding transcription regulator [Lactobacillus sp. ESL0731]